jgi:ubiquinone/menaquinone biosynthesis C-methylase UbiE
VLAFEVDTALHAASITGPRVRGLTFMLGGADAIPLPDRSCDVVLMMKSLHHVPVDRMDLAMSELRRVLAPGGYAYVSEPVYAGPYNDLVRLFHDEGAVRAAAYDALRRAATSEVLEWVEEIDFDMPIAYRDFEDFDRRMIRTTPNGKVMSDAQRAEVRRAFDKHMGAAGVRFVRPMRLNVMRRADGLASTFAARGDAAARGGGVDPSR